MTLALLGMPSLCAAAKTFDLGAEATVGLTWLAGWIIGFGVLIVFGLMILWAVRAAMREDYTPSYILFGAILLVFMAWSIASGAGSGITLGKDGANQGQLVTDYPWQVFGGDPASPSYKPSAAPAHMVQVGWAIMGATFSYNILNYGFVSGIIPIVVFIGALMAVRAAQRSHSVAPIIMHLIVMFVGGYFLLWPSVSIVPPINQNAVLQEIRESPGDDPIAVVTPMQVMALQGGIGIGEGVTRAFTMQNNDVDSVLLAAALSAKLDDDVYNTYMTYASTCMTAMLSVNKNRKVTTAATSGFGRFNDEKFGASNLPVAEGTLGKYLSAPNYAQHALSPYADSMFRDIYVPYWVVTKNYDQVFKHPADIDRAIQLNGLIKQASWHPNPLIGSGDVGTVPAAGERRYNVEWPAYYSGMSNEGWALWDYYGSANIGSPRWLPFCAVDGIGVAASMRDSLFDSTQASEMMTDVYFGASGMDRVNPFSWDDIVRMRIADRYVNGDSVEWCTSSVSPDKNESHLWGCLLAGHYTVGGTPQADAMVEAQERFDAMWRPVLEDSATQVNDDAADGGLYSPQTRWRTSFPAGIPVNGFNPPTWRWYVDQFMIAPGVQEQIGLAKLTTNKGEEIEESVVIKLMRSIAPITGGVLGIFGWVATLFARIAEMIYPHALGIMTLWLLVTYVPCAVLSMLPGRYGFFIEWVKAAAVLAIMPIFIEVGLNFLSMAGNSGLTTIFIRQAAGQTMTEAVLKIMGAMFVISSFTLATSMVGLGFSSIMSGLGAINSTAFKVAAATGVVAMGVASLAAGAGAALVAKGLLAAGAAKTTGGLAKTALTSSKTAKDTGKKVKDGTEKLTKSVTQGANQRAPVDGGQPRGGGDPRIVSATQQFNAEEQRLRSERGETWRNAGRQVSSTAGSAVSTVGSTLTLGGGDADLVSGAQQGLGIAGGLARGTGDARRAMRTGGALRRARKLGMGEREAYNASPDDALAADYANVATTFDRQRENALANGEDATEYGQQAGENYWNASRTASDDLTRANYAIASSRAYQSVGMTREASNGRRAAARDLEGARVQARDSSSLGQLGLGEMNLASLDVEMGISKGNASAVQQGMSNIERFGDKADWHFSRAATEAGGDGSLDGWIQSSSATMGQLEVARGIDSAANMSAPMIGGGEPQAVEGFFEKKAANLRNQADSGSEQASIVLGALLARAGRVEEARSQLAGTSLNLEDVELDRSIQQLRDGRFSTVESLLRRL
ncbi:MAG: hypothetical protein PF961_10520 [Planctomycetota bacterium]|nr:hypothetical protein [Planctomycetota bacterium]